MNDKDLFQGYEVKNWDFSKRIYKIIATATIFNLLVLFGLGQTNLISTSACESPFVSNVCDVLDTVYVGSKLFGVDSDYVNEAYTQTEISDADIVWVDTTNVQPQLAYPTGYFEIANRDEIAAEKALLNQQDAFLNNSTTGGTPFTPNQIPSSKPSAKSPSSGFSTSRSRRFGSGSRNKRKSSRRASSRKKSNSKIIGGKIKDDLFDFGDENPKKGTVAGKDPKKTPKKDPKNDSNSIADKTAKKSDPVDDSKPINKKPLEDFTNAIVTEYENKSIDLTKKFDVELISKLTDDGRFDTKNLQFNAKEGDEDIVKIAKDALLAIGDSGFLKYLRVNDIKEIRLSLIQDDKKIYARVISNQKTAKKAIETARGLSGVISVAKLSDRSEDEMTLLNSAKLTNDGRNFVMTIDIPKDQAQKMMESQLKTALQKRNAKKEKQRPPKKPNGEARKTDIDKNSGK